MTVMITLVKPVKYITKKKKTLLEQSLSLGNSISDNYRTNSNSRYFGQGHFSLSTISSSLSTWLRISSSTVNRFVVQFQLFQLHLNNIAFFRASTMSLHLAFMAKRVRQFRG